MKLTDMIVVLPAVNNGWAFGAFIVLVAVWLYFGRRDVP